MDMLCPLEVVRDVYAKQLDYLNVATLSTTSPLTDTGEGESLRIELMNISFDFVIYQQGRPVNVKHDARCIMGKVRGGGKNPKREEF